MTKERSPYYHASDPTYRVIYRPSQRWVAQRKGYEKATRELDPWEDLHSPVDTRDEALRIMRKRMPERS